MLTFAARLAATAASRPPPRELAGAGGTRWPGIIFRASGHYPAGRDISYRHIETNRAPY